MDLPLPLLRYPIGQDGHRDLELAGESFQFAGGRMGDDGDPQACIVALHEAEVLKHERAVAPREICLDHFEDDVSR